MQTFGRLDALVNNASSFFQTPVGEITEASLERPDRHQPAGAAVPRAGGRARAASRTQGAIVNLSDIHAERPLKNYVVYSIAKAGLGGPHTLAGARTGARRARQRRGARVRSCGPTTNRSTNCRGSGSSRTRRCKREGTPDDIARAVHFLLADADYITGETINVDGGRNMAI